MNKDVNIKKLAKHWKKVRAETIKVCVEHLDCKECPFHTIVKDDTICLIGRLNTAIEKLKGTPNFVFAQNLERGDD